MTADMTVAEGSASQQSASGDVSNLLTQPTDASDLGSGADSAALAGHIAELTLATDQRIAVAESLTSGRLACELGAAQRASDWFAGSIVAYRPQIKFDVLAVTPGPVNTARCAQEMAEGALQLFNADLAIAATGVGGPGPDEGVPAGTVFIAVAGRHQEPIIEELHVSAEPSVVLDTTVHAALSLLVRCFDGETDPADAPTLVDRPRANT